MKAIIVLLVLGALVLGGIYFFGGYSTMDPTEEGRQAKAAITPGMNWKQVIDKAGEPQRYIHMSKKKTKIGNRWVETVAPGSPVKFRRSKLERRIKDNDVPDGFMFRYQFSQQVAFDVSFDGKGTVESVQDTMTMADLLQTREE